MLFNFALLVYFLVLFSLCDQIGRQFFRIEFHGEIWSKSNFVILAIIAIAGFVGLSGAIRISSGFPPTEIDVMRIVKWLTILTVLVGLVEGVGLHTILIKNGLVKRK